jgi:hypothetical protein
MQFQHGEGDRKPGGRFLQLQPLACVQGYATYRNPHQERRNNMSLSIKARDTELTFKLAVAGWLAASAAAIAGATWLMAPADLRWAYRDYQLARVADFFGLGQVPVIPMAGSQVSPAGFLAWASEKLPATMLADWAGDLRILVLIPPSLALAMLMVAGAIHLHNHKKGAMK